MKYLILLISSACLFHVGESKPSHSSGYNSGSHGGYGSAVHAPVGYHGPLAVTHVLSDGHIADTPEVAAAKQLHYSAVHKAMAEAAAHGYSEDDGSYGSGGGYALSYASGAGYGSSYGSGAGYGSSHGSNAGYASSYGSGVEHSKGHSYSGPLAYPKVLPSGLLADTYEVAAAKHSHLNAVAVTAKEHAEKWANNNYH